MYVQCKMCSGAVFRRWGVFENFCAKSSLTVCKASFKYKLQKMGLRMYYLLPNNFVGEQLLPLLPQFLRVCIS